MNKARPALNENQPRVEQEMLWAGFLKVKRCNYRMAFWNQFILEPTSGLPSLVAALAATLNESVNTRA
jgi:hypothetical protein